MSNEQSQPCLLTIGTCNRRAGIAVVAESFLKYHPTGRTFTCLVDRPDPSMPALHLPGEIFFADELALPGRRRFLFKYQAFELCCALKPYAIRYVMERFRVSHLVYLDSDILVTSAFWGDLHSFWTTHSVLLTPHLVRLPLDSSPEAQRSLMQHGSYNGGFLASRQSDDGVAFLDWWARALESLCTFDTMNNVYVDQRWLDLAAASSTTVGILRDPGLNVAYWNLHERELREDAAGKWSSNGTPLKFFHFSGFHRQQLTTKSDCRDAMAMRLSDIYGTMLDAAGEAKFNSFPYGWEKYNNQEGIANSHRDLILTNHPDLQHVSDPFSLPRMAQEWERMKELAASLGPARVTDCFKDGATALDMIRRLDQHPIIGLVWKLWRRWVNPSLGSGLPPHVHS